jgi:hypothetical protein
MTEPSEAERAAEKLTAAQRAAILNARTRYDLGFGSFEEVRAGGATVALCKKGLIRSREVSGLTGRSRRAYALTVTGLAVRREIIKQQEKNSGLR